MEILYYYDMRSIPLYEYWSNHNGIKPTKYPPNDSYQEDEFDKVIFDEEPVISIQKESEFSSQRLSTKFIESSGFGRSTLTPFCTFGI
ncbi:hypothetical protein CYY_002961 [Polysphondylium violaceum]|uniref:Uncharacterized protein n=1 Tax=Polysphondylium violaceum TaxID=133409 RepID=A0A8J4V1R3_9MYCE|nr:hypothetical protein CYY_002961 [Polysphondylium violaceum]